MNGSGVGGGGFLLKTIKELFNELLFNYFEIRYEFFTLRVFSWLCLSSTATFKVSLVM